MLGLPPGSRADSKHPVQRLIRENARINSAVARAVTPPRAIGPVAVDMCSGFIVLLKWQRNGRMVAALRIRYGLALDASRLGT